MLVANDGEELAQLNIRQEMESKEVSLMLKIMVMTARAVCTTYEGATL